MPCSDFALQSMYLSAVFVFIVIPIIMYTEHEFYAKKMNLWYVWLIWIKLVIPVQCCWNVALSKVLFLECAVKPRTCLCSGVDVKHLIALGVQRLVLLSHSSRDPDLIIALGGASMVFACSPQWLHGFLWVLWYTPTCHRCAGCYVFWPCKLSLAFVLVDQLGARM